MVCVGRYCGCSSMEAQKVSQIAPHLAANAYRGRVTDPAGLEDADSAVVGCQSFRLDGSAGHAVFTLDGLRSGTVWIRAAAGEGPGDMTAQTLQAIEAMAAQVQARRLGFQTARPGLVRKAARHGYRVTGWILQKDLTQ